MVAALVHAWLVLAIVHRQPPGLTAISADDGAPGISVSLVRWSSDAPQASAAQSEAERLEQLRQSLVGTQPASPPEPPAKPPSDAEAILAAFDKAHQPPPGPSALPQAAHVGQAGSSNIIAPFGGVAVPIAYLRAVAGTVLWPQLSRCWRPVRAQPKVELLVTLDEHGKLTEPPGIVREPSAQVDDVRLKAEAEAVRAATACAPYAASTGEQRSFRLDFPAQASGRG